MKRRFFMQSIGAFAMSPSLPLKALAVPTRKAHIASYTPQMKGHALALLRTKGSLGLDEFQRLTGLNLSQTEKMLGHLRQTGLVRGDVFALGRVEAAKPFWMNKHEVLSKLPSKIAEQRSQFKISMEDQDGPPKFSEINKCCGDCSRNATALKGDEPERGERECEL